MKPVFAKLWKRMSLPRIFQLGIMRLINDKFLVGVTGLVFNEREEVLLFEHTYREDGWSLPGGYLKKGESPKDGLKREINEESGFLIVAGEEINVSTEHDSPRLDISVTGKLIGGTFIPSAEVKNARFFDVSKLPLLPFNQSQLIRTITHEKKNMTQHVQKAGKAFINSRPAIPFGYV